MFPKWEFDVEDTLAENIIKLMFPAVVSPAKKKVVKKDKAAAEASEEMATTEIKYLSEMVEAVEKKVGITTKRKGTSSQNTTSPPKPMLEPGSESVNGTNAGRKSLAEDKDLQKEDARYLEKRDAALALCRAKSDRTRKLAASQKSPYTANSTARVIISNRKLYPGYNPFAPIDKTKLKELLAFPIKPDCFSTFCVCSHYRTALDKKPRKSRTWWYQILRTSLEWLEDCHIDAWINVLKKRHDANPQHFRSERICFLDYLFAQQWIFNFKDFKDSKLDHNGLGRRLPEELDVVMEPFLYMVPYLLVECASSDEVRAQYSLEPFTYERPTNIPPARAGDCGMYTLKYIECHALGIEFSKKDFAKPNGKSMRDKMVVDIFQELPDVHEFENKYMDDILGTYDV
ncbi:unnamed protein product [Brassica oleracea]